MNKVHGPLISYVSCQSQIPGIETKYADWLIASITYHYNDVVSSLQNRKIDSRRGFSASTFTIIARLGHFRFLSFTYWYL